ncbi:MAG: P-loop NTPase [Fibrobacteres bacterium]|nr:P-loop NTPase [Fibrobacterota bacterium]
MDEHVHSEFSAIAIDHARSPRNRGFLPVFDGHASISGSCGDSMDMWIRVEDGEIADLRFSTDGCGSSIACGSMATELAKGRSLAGIAIMRPRDVLDRFQGFPHESAHCAELAIDSLKAACQDYFRSIPMGSIARKILVLSGKGGVGKSTVALHLAKRLRAAGSKVGILDADIHSPTLPSLMKIGPVSLQRSGDRLVAHDHEGLRLMSMAFLSPSPDQAVILRGPRKTMLVRQFLREVDWGELDAMVIDTPSGTGDELLTVVKSAGALEGAVVVCTPQEVAISGARRSIAFCREMGVPLLGLVENMSGTRCPRCGHVAGAASVGQELARELDLPFLGSVPTEPEISAPSPTFEADLAAILDPVVARRDPTAA